MFKGSIDSILPWSPEISVVEVDPETDSPPPQEIKKNDIKINKFFIIFPIK